MKHAIFLILGILAFAHHVQAQEFDRRQNDAVPAQVESIYLKGLNYLAKTQKEDGKWDESQETEVGVASLCTLAFLAHGEDPNSGPYAKNISRALDFIISKQDQSNGYIGESMYNHGFATLTLAEAYGAADNPKIAKALKSAVDLILSAQKRNENKAWRYSPDATDSDSTVTGCQIKALYAARNAGIPVPDQALRDGLNYIEKCRSADGSYGYTSAGNGKPTLSAIGLLCQSLSKKKDTKSYAASLNYLKDHINFREQMYPFYFEYYMSQALFQADIKIWEEWNAKNIKLLATVQSPDGSWNSRLGSSFSTAGALLSLALNYRFLPIYER